MCICICTCIHIYTKDAEDYLKEAQSVFLKTDERKGEAIVLSFLVLSLLYISNISSMLLLLVLLLALLVSLIRSVIVVSAITSMKLIISSYLLHIISL